jgi:hypothetical protein
MIYVLITRCEMIISTIYCVSRLAYIKYEAPASRAGRYELSSIEFFVIDFLFNCRQNCQKESFRKKKKKKMFFEIFNQYRKSRSIFNESDADLTQEALAKRELSRSTSHERKTTSVVKKIVQIKSSTTISSLQAVQMLSR